MLEDFPVLMSDEVVGVVLRFKSELLSYKILNEVRHDNIITSKSVE